MSHTYDGKHIKDLTLQEVHALIRDKTPTNKSHGYKAEGADDYPRRLITYPQCWYAETADGKWEYTEEGKVIYEWGHCGNCVFYCLCQLEDGAFEYIKFELIEELAPSA